MDKFIVSVSSCIGFNFEIKQREYKVPCAGNGFVVCWLFHGMDSQLIGNL